MHSFHTNKDFNFTLQNGVISSPDLEYCSKVMETTEFVRLIKSDDKEVNIIPDLTLSKKVIEKTLCTLEEKME